ncbi:MAG: hypothetical protein KJ749_01185, partial [Planctomycetes bacterium]|nr:hypothetical protein [Planctomycetota bacterium]
MDPRDIEEALFEAATKKYDEADLSGITLYLDPDYPLQALSEWAMGKFGIKIEVEGLRETPRDQVSEFLKERVRAGYREREVAYPVESCLERAFSQGGTDSAVAAAWVVQWANRKFGLGWTLANIQGRTPTEIHGELVEVNRSFFDGRLEEEIDRNLAGKDREAAVAWAKERFGSAWKQQRFEEFDGNLKDALLEQGREMLRWELSRLEQYVLLRLHDQAWKDHLLEMDHLKSAIMQRPLGGDTAHPQSQFAIEGRGLFDQMWTRIANRVTDIIFKVRAVDLDDDRKNDEADSWSAPWWEVYLPAQIADAKVLTDIWPGGEDAAIDGVWDNWFESPPK